MSFVEGATAAGVLLRFPRTIGRYIYVRTLSSGASCVAIEVVNCMTHEHLACKVVSRQLLTESGAFSSFEQELRVHQFLNHPNIVKIHDILYEPDFVFVFLDLCACDLLTFIVNHPSAFPSIYRPIIIHILKGLEYLHARGIAHRDIKPDNILLTQSNDAKLADFGNCEVVNQAGEPKAGGTIIYAAPEIFLKSSTVGIKADIWSFGIVLFVMFAGQLPWQDGDRDVLVDQITHRRVSSAFLIPRDAEGLFQRCTELDPAKRPSVTELLKDPWLLSEPTRKITPGMSQLSMSMSQLTFIPTGPMRRSSCVSAAPAAKKRLNVRPKQSRDTRASLSQALPEGFQVGRQISDV
jgi:serine/threonine protein kinase